MKTSHWLSLACLLATASGYAHAGFKPIEVKDQELAELRGRYVMPGRVISFGIVMSSTWRNASGDLIGATSAMQIQAATVKPEFYVSTIKQTGNGSVPDQGSGNITGGAGLGTSQGVTQSVRAAGDGNTAYNNVNINVKESNQAPALVPSQGPVADQGPDHQRQQRRRQCHKVTATGSGVQMAIQASHNQGSTLQQVAQGGLLQNTRLLGNSNLVNNMTQLNVVLNNNGPSAGALDCNLTQLRGLRNLGY